MKLESDVVSYTSIFYLQKIYLKPSNSDVKITLILIMIIRSDVFEFTQGVMKINFFVVFTTTNRFTI